MSENMVESWADMHECWAQQAAEEAGEVVELLTPDEAIEVLLNADNADVPDHADNADVATEAEVHECIAALLAVALEPDETVEEFKQRVLGDVLYAVRQLRMAEACKAGASSWRDCAQRALDALGRVEEACK